MTISSYKKLFLIGGGGHAKSVYQVLRENGIEVSGYIDIKKNDRLNLNFLHEDTFLKKFRNCLSKPRIIVALGTKKDFAFRTHIIEKYSSFPSFSHIISNSANVACDVSIDDGTIIMPGACVRTETKIGRNCIINTMSSIDHECVLKDNIHVAPGAILCGGVKVQHNVFVGAGSIIFPGVKIAENTTIPAGSIIRSELTL